MAYKTFSYNTDPIKDSYYYYNKGYYEHYNVDKHLRELAKALLSKHKNPLLNTNLENVTFKLPSISNIHQQIKFN